jgi:DNA sulfur modification protein DndD
MIFNYIRFENYRPYYGVQQINLYKDSNDFSPYKKNIILIGGLNGAGKTSLINAFFICLYGRRKYKNDEYEVIKKEAINRRYLREGGRESKIQLSFTERTGTYVIEVTFSLDHKNEVTETRKIYVVSGEELREVTSTDEAFNEFIDERIPVDVAPFFIFDAEKIRDLVGEHDKRETVQAIQKIVSLELYNQLYEDLSSIKYKDELNLAKSVKDSEIEKLTEELEKCSMELEVLRAEEKPDEMKIEYLKAEKISLEQKRRIKLASSSQTKAQINRRIGELENELKQIQVTIERFGRGSLPRMIVSPMVKSLQARIIKEQDYIANKSKSKLAFAPYDKFIGQLLSVQTQPPLTETQLTTLKEKGRDIWAKLNHIQHVKVEPIDILHVNDLSQNEIQTIKNWSVSTSLDIKGLINKRITVQKEVEQLINQLNDAPDVIDTKEEDEKITLISEELGALYAKRKTRNEVLRRLHDRHHQLQNELTRKRETQSKLGPIEKKIELMTRLMNATKEFIDRVTVLKAQQLKMEIENILMMLFRKKDLHRVEFDPNEFVLRIYNEFDEEIDLNSRSEGEKQLIALSMIWALTKVSGTNFPFVIDTPLARLDSIHRSNIVNRFFTNLSDQVIILTTDTEITKEFVEEIEPFVQYSYILEYNDADNATKVCEGYFQFE